MGNRTFSLIAALCGLSAAIHAASAQSYRVERVASGLQQPLYVDQAPGDPDNIIYYMTRVTTGGVNAGSGTHGSLWRYDMDTQASTEVLNLSHRDLTLDLGPQGLAFHPDFNNPGTDGFQKVYVSSAATGGPVNYVEEYELSGPGGTVPTGRGGIPLVNRTLLEYNNVFGDNNHVIDWIGFDPRAYSAAPGSPERNYLYISAGDGSNGRPADQRPEQKSTIAQGKLLRIDIDPAKPDFYPADPAKNFAIPDTNPIPLWNAANPGNELLGTTLNYTGPTESVSYSPALQEIYFTGTRNTFRMSMDKLTGDFWSGDVGEFAREEINFLPADPYDGTQAPYDFGFPQREGTGVFVNRSNGDTSIQWDLAGGGAIVQDSINPIREGAHAIINSGSTAGDVEIRDRPRGAYIGGYVYRGPIEELQGKYFYADFTQGNIFSLDFDATTPVADFSGDNFNLVPDESGTNVASLGTREVVLNRNLNSLWHTLMVDPNDPTYTADLGADFGIGRIVSFGEDNDGNLYIVDMGGQRGNSGFNNDYPAGSTGQIFRLVPNLLVYASVDRVTGAITFSNETGEPLDVLGYELSSVAGSLDDNFLTGVTGVLDSSGNGEVDAANAWQVTSAPGDSTRFAEESTGTAATLAIDQAFAISTQDGWTQSIYEDVKLDVTLGNGSTIAALVRYTGNSGSPFDRGDLNFDGVLDAADWVAYRQNFFGVFAGASAAESYGLGDLDGDGDNDYDDFLLFKADYIAANGAAAFEALGQIPEPAAALLLTLAAAAGAVRTNRRRRSGAVAAGRPRLGAKLAVTLVAATAALAADAARADLQHLYSFNNGLNDSIGGADGQAFGAAAVNGQGQLDLPGGFGDYVGFDPQEIQISSYTDLTFETWFTVDTHQTWARLFDYGSRDVTPEGYLYFAPQSGQGGNPALARYATNDVRTEITYATPSEGQQHHLAMIVDDNANGGADLFTVYFDGVLIDSVSHNHPLSGVIETYAFLGKSTFPGDVDPYFNGSIDEFRIYDHALSQQEVLDSIAAGTTQESALTIYVNTYTGAITMASAETLPVDIDYYAISSAAGALSTASWNSLQDQGGAVVGTGEGWEEIDQSNATKLGELRLLGQSSVVAGAPLAIGAAYDPAVLGLGTDGDLTFEYGLAGVSTVAGEVVYLDFLPGDFNGDLQVDAADYTLWRDGLAAADHTGPDGHPDGVVDALDYQVWTSHYGASAVGGAPAAVPEPAALVLLVSVLTAATVARR
ncbi:hypothetical protein Pla123a_01300 [Posidoniimonas polymericola]|uniref:LamG-like jellyroll fold domain-containing protein n=1 Tax=Posidoniimonas polymericola TaxID=2528002 RepID=A0A5C5ZFI9_9BACT|nr:LamG domain-containing protein [Posidoniimonas polymericola]TWT85323.1 hypothetical protein Pla123a_01300 [Posidoniimonas polymericola]